MWDFINNTAIGEYIKNHVIIVVAIAILLSIFIYSVIAVILNRLNKTMYGKTTWMAWVPVLRIFLLGKLTVHIVLGIVLVIGMIPTFSITLTNKGIQEEYAILHQNIRIPYTIIYFAIIIVLLVYADIKQKSIEREKGDENIKNNNINVTSVYDERFSKRLNNNVTQNELSKSDSTKQEDSFYKSDDYYSKRSDIVHNNTGSPLSKLMENDPNKKNNP